MPYEPDKKKADESSFEKLPGGKYKCRIEKAEEKVSAKGNEMMSFQAIVLGGDHDGRFVFFNIVYTMKTADARFKELCLACGIDWKKTKSMTTQLFKGKVLNVVMPEKEDGWIKFKPVESEEEEDPFEEEDEQEEDEIPI